MPLTGEHVAGKTFKVVFGTEVDVIDAIKMCSQRLSADSIRPVVSARREERASSDDIYRVVKRAGIAI